jgi:tetratricopeptide (TPR) repeat protein
MHKLVYINFLILVLILTACTSGKDLRPGYKKLLTETSSMTHAVDSNYINAEARKYVINGSSLQQKYKWAESILEFQQALRYDSSSAIFYAIARSYKEMKKYDLALENIAKSLKRDSAFITSMELAAGIYISKFEIEKAVEVYEQIVIFEPTFRRKTRLANFCEFSKPLRAIEIYEELTAE